MREFFHKIERARRDALELGVQGHRVGKDFRRDRSWRAVTELPNTSASSAMANDNDKEPAGSFAEACSRAPRLSFDLMGLERELTRRANFTSSRKPDQAISLRRT